jgi:hypothetical protein
VKSTGECSAGNPHAAFVVEGFGNLEWSDYVVLTLANESASEQENKIRPKPKPAIDLDLIDKGLVNPALNFYRTEG